MTTYTIHSQSIQKLLNPFDNPSLVSGEEVEAFTHREVREIQKNMASKVDFKTDCERVAFYASSYPAHKLIEISLDTQTNTLHLKNKESLLLLWAACYRQLSEVKISFNGDIKIFEDPQAKEVSVSSLKKDHIDWSQSFQNQWSKWDDKDFILQFIPKTSLSHQKIFANIKPSLLEDDEFLLELSKRGFTKFIIEANPSKSLHYIQLFKDNPKVMLSLWEEHLKDNYVFAQEDVEKAIMREAVKVFEKLNRTNPKTVDGFDVEKLVDVPQRRLDHLHAQKIKQACDEHIFKNTQTCEYFLQHAHQTEVVTSFFSLAAIQQSKIYDLLLEKSKYLHLPQSLQLIPEGFYYKSDGTADYSKRNILLSSAMALPSQFAWVAGMKWMKEDTLESLQAFSSCKSTEDSHMHKKHVDTTHAYKYLIPKTLKKNEEVVTCLINLDNRLYTSLTPAFKLKPRVLSAYLQRDGNPANVPKQALFKQTDEEVIMKILDASPSLLMDSDCPPSWRVNPRFLYKRSPSMLKLSDDELRTIFSNPEAGCHLLEHNNRFYECLPEDLKEKEIFALSHIKTSTENFNTQEQLKKVPSILWAVDDFCLKALCMSDEVAPYVPSFLWNDISFLRQVFNNMDNQEICVEVLEKMPSVIKEFFETFEIEEGYAQFFDNYLLQQELANGLASSSKRDKKPKL